KEQAGRESQRSEQPGRSREPEPGDQDEPGDERAQSGAQGIEAVDERDAAAHPQKVAREQADRERKDGADRERRRDQDDEDDEELPQSGRQRRQVVREGVEIEAPRELEDRQRQGDVGAE